MLKLKTKKTIVPIFFTLLGMAYFSAFSSLEINSLLRNYLVIVPVQVLALAFNFVAYYWRFKYKEKDIKN